MDPTFAPFAAHAYVEAGLDRADPLRLNTTALAALWPCAHVVRLDDQFRALADRDGQWHDHAAGRLDALPDNALFLGIDRQDEVPWFAVVDTAAEGEMAVELRQAATQWPAVMAARFAYARAVLHWQQRTRFCPACGQALVVERAGFVGRCTACQQEHYPRVDPAVIVAVTAGDRLLLGRQSGWPEGRYSLIAGFVEPGETLEQAVVREVHEETAVSVDIRSCRYLGSQPWPFPGALMLGFRAHCKDVVTPRVDGELEAAGWYDREAVGQALAGTHPTLHLPPPLSIARSLIAHWHAGGV